MLCLVEDSFGIQDRIIDPPRTEGTRVKQDREPAMEGESNPETDFSKTVRSLRTQNADWTSLRPHSSLIQISPESTRTLPCSGVLSEKTNLPQSTPEWSRTRELTDDIICILHKHQPMSCSVGSTEGRGTQSPAGSNASPPSLSQRRQLLKSGYPPSRTLQSLRERIHQQRQQHQAVQGSTTEVYQRGAITRKVRKVTFAPPPPICRGFTVVPERTESPGEGRASLQPSSKGTTHRRDKTQGTGGRLKSPRLKKTTSPSTPPCRDVSRQTRGRSPGVSAWRDGQRLVRMLLGPVPRPKRGESATQGPGESQFSEEKNDIKPPSKKKLFPSNGNPGLSKRSPSLLKRSPSPSQRTTALPKRSPSPSQRTIALSKRSPTPSQRTTALSKRSPSQISTVLSKKSTSPSHSPSQKSPIRSTRSPVPSQSPTHSKRHQDPQSGNSSPPTSSSAPKGRTAGWGGKENTVPQEPQRTPKARSYSVEEVRAFMGRRAKERTRRALEERREARREDERRRGLLEEVLRKQRDALHRTQGSRSPGAYSRKRQRDTDTKKEGPAAGGQSDGDNQDRLQWSGDRVGRAQQQCRGAPLELLSVEGAQREVCSLSPLRLADLAPAGRLAGGAGTAPLSRAERVEAIRQAAAALGTRVETEIARLSVGARARQQTVPGCSKTGQSGTSALPRDLDSTSVSEELPWSEDPEQPGGRGTQPDSTGSTRGVCKERKQKAGRVGTAKTGAQSGSLPPGRLVRGGTENRVEKERQQETSQAGQRSTSPGTGQSRTQPSFKGSTQTGPEALSDDVGGPGASEASQKAEASSSSEADTESTSKWSEVSQFFGRGEMLNRLSLELSQQTLRDEELRARHHSALFRLREEALSEKTHAELAWLEHQKMCLREGEEDTLAEIARRQEDVLCTLRQEKTEIRHLQSVYRAARQQRKLLLRHQREILGIQRAAALIKSKLLGDSALNQQNPESAEQQLQGGLENNTALHQLQGDLSKHSAVHRSQGKLKKRCALRQFQDDVKKDGAVHQSHRDLHKYCALQLSQRDLHENTAVLHLQGDLNKYSEVQQEDTKLHQLQGSPEEFTTLNKLKGDHEEDTTLHNLKGGPQEGTTLHHLEDGPQEDTLEDITLYDLQGEEPARTAQQKLQEDPQKDTTLHKLPGSPFEDPALHNIRGDSQEDSTLHQLHSDVQKHFTDDRGNTTWEQIPDQSSSSEKPGSSPGPEPRERRRRVAEHVQNTSSELGDSRQRWEDRFVIKTERDTCPTEGSWNWEKRKSDPEILGLETDILHSDPEYNEQDIQNLETKQSELDSLHSDQENSDTDNQEWDDKEWGSEDHETGKIVEGSKHVVEDRTQTDGQVIEGKACNLESEKEERSQKNIAGYESSEEESSCSRFNLKLHLSSNSNDLSWKSQKSLGSYPSLQEFQKASAVLINISETSISSLETEEEIPLDTESSKGEVLETGSPQGLGSPDTKSTRMSNEASPIKEECSEEVNQQQITKVPRDSMRHNSQNDYLTQSGLLVDHNPFKSKQCILPQFPGAVGGQFHQSYTVVKESKKDLQDISESILPRVEFPKGTSSAEQTTEGKPNKGCLFLDLEPRSPDSSLKISASSSDNFSESEAPEPQEEFSLSSPELVSSREEQIILEGIEWQGKGTSDHENNLKPLAQSKASRETESQVTKNSTGQPCPETPSSLTPKLKRVFERHVELSSSGRVLEKEQAPKDSPLSRSAMRDCASINSRRPLSDENLSEIVSPVDEVLSYGSAELPPPIARESGCEDFDDLPLPPPPPAGEVITWTSEDASFQSEDFPLPPEELGHFGKERPQFPADDDPSIKSEDLPSLSEDLAPPVEECYTEELNSSLQEKQLLDPMDKSMVAVNHKCEKQTLEVEANGSQFQPSQENVEHQEQSSQHSKKGNPFVTLTSADESDSDSLSDPLSSFHIGDRVLVCHTKPGVLKFKGLTSFATGHWAGVALDSPSGHHNGTYRGIRYFECPKNCGVLVRAEDISHLLGGQETDSDFKANEGPFSDGDSPEKFRSLRDNIGDRGSSEGSGEGREKRSGEKRGKQPSGENGEKRSTAPKVCEAGSYSLAFEEMNNNIQNTAVFIEEEWNLAQSIPSSTASEFSAGETDLQQIIKEAARAVELLANPESKQNEQDIYLKLDSSVTTNTNKKLGSQLPADRMIQELPETIQRKSQSISGAPLIGERHTHKEEMGDSSTIDSSVLSCLVHSVAVELLSEVVREFQGIRNRKQQQEVVRTRGTLTNTPKSHEPGAGIPGSQTIEKCQQEPHSPSILCYLDQWQCTTSTGPPLEGKRLHDPARVRTLVGSAVERLWIQATGQKVGECGVQGKREEEDCMADEESRKAYKQVIFDLTSDIFHEAFQEDLNTSTSLWRGKGVSTLSALLSSRPTLKEVKSAMQVEVLRLLNLDCSDLEMRRILQKMSKFGKAQRDRVDYILIQELHQEEPQWMDYSADELSVKMRLTEEIFDALLQDTIKVLKHIDGAPPSASPRALQPAFSTG
ncbi:centrosome-associated protein 350-like isoform X2 [Polyodon spathula]|nr:centrosome-associated protein 350-like isoform X2 [Polyodon spathula]